MRKFIFGENQLFKMFFKKHLFYRYGYFAYMNFCAPHVCVVGMYAWCSHRDLKRLLDSLEGWTCRQLWAAMQVLGIKPGSSKRVDWPMYLVLVKMGKSLVSYTPITLAVEIKRIYQAMHGRSHSRLYKPSPMCDSVHLNFTLPHAQETNSPTKAPEKLKLLIWEPQLKTDYFPK